MSIKIERSIYSGPTCLKSLDSKKISVSLVFRDILLNRRMNFIVNPLTYVEIRYKREAKSNHSFWHLKMSILCV